MKSKAIEIINKASTAFPDFRKRFEDSDKISSETIIFGSYAFGCENIRSDIDILFVGDGTRKSGKNIDFIWVKKQDTEANKWLGSELANHLVEYGIWYRGEGLWKNKVFFSESAIAIKKNKIYTRLTQLLIKKDRLSYKYKMQFMHKVILNYHRLRMLYQKIPNPPSCLVVQMINKDRKEFISEIFSDNYLGNVGKTMIKEIFPNIDINYLINKICDDLFELYAF